MNTLAPATLWRLLEPDVRAKGLVLALAGHNGPWLRDTLTDLIERRGGFRASTIRGWSAERISAACAKQDIDKRGIIIAMVTALHLPGRAHLQDAFLDELGVSGDVLDSSSEDDALAPVEHVERAATGLLRRFRSDEALYYLLCLALLWPKRWLGLEEWLARFGAQELDPPRVPQGSGEPVVAQAVQGEVDLPARLQEAAVPPIVIPSETIDPSPLDDALLQLIVYTKGEIQGAPGLERIDSMLREFTRLNGSRHQSFYLVGFRDALFGIPDDRDLPATNANRRRWYFAGLIAGLRREKRGEEIVALFHAEESVQSLGNTGRGPSAQAAHHVFASLCEQELYSAACGFISAEAIAGSKLLLDAVLSQATTLLRDERPDEAGPMFDLLWHGLSIRKSEGLTVNEATWADVRRRRAHCLRHTDNLEGARALLSNLLEDRSDVNRPAVLVDLGLMDGGLRRLADLHLPRDEAERDQLLEALNKGSHRYQEAERLEERTRSHALYVRGFQELLRREDRRAREYLEQAVAAFSQRPQVYSGGGLLDRAHLHLGLAICLSVPSATDMARGVRLIVEGLKKGGSVSPLYVDDLFLAIEATAPKEAMALSEAMLQAGGEGVLEATAATTAGRRLPVITDAILARARDGRRSLTARAEDWLRALPALQYQRRIEEQEEGLDALEASAMQGVLTDQVMRLLHNESEYGPAWTTYDARWALARLAESRGDFHAAAGMLERVFYEIVNKGEDHLPDRSRDTARDEARQVVERIGDYGPQFKELHGQLGLFLDLRLGEEVAPGTGEPCQSVIRILFVGGNEVQAQYDREVKAELNANYPHIWVEFMHTGWGSNWSGYRDDFERRVSAFNGVVVSRYMRTMLGRSIRRACSVPWRGCGGTGRASIRNSILAAADFARRHMTGEHPVRNSRDQRIG